MKPAAGLSEEPPFQIDYILESLERKGNISVKTKERVDLFVKALSLGKIDMKIIKSLCFQGIPEDSKGLRSLCWKLVTGYLSPNSSRWSAEIEKNRKLYEEYIHEFITSKSKGEEQGNSSGSSSITFVKVKDHPLNRSKESEWNNFFKDVELWDLVEKDTTRTRSEMHFFLSRTESPGKYPILSKATNKNAKDFIKDIKKEEMSKRATSDEKVVIEFHYDVLSRILFLFAKMNPGIKYVQGMNEILAPIYYAFANDENPTFRENAEVDAFFCFSIIMGEIKDNFIKKLDTSSAGIKARLKAFQDVLKKVDEEIWEYFEKIGLNPQFYCLRWLMLMLTQEFPLHDILRLWDSLLSHPNKIIFLNYVCAAIVVSLKKKLIDQEFSIVMQRLQRLEGFDTSELLSLANHLYREFSTEAEIKNFLNL